MNITDLPPDAMRETLFHLPPKDVITYCTTNKDILAQCDDYPFLRNYMSNNFGGLNIDSIKINGSPWDKFVFVNNLIKRLRSWDRRDLILDKARYLDDQDEKGYRSPTVDAILLTTVSMNNPELLSVLLEILAGEDGILGVRLAPGVLQNEAVAYHFQSSAGSEAHYRYNHILMNTFLAIIRRISLEEVRNESDPMLQTILRYYMPDIDFFLVFGIFHDTIKNRDVDMFNKLLTYKPFVYRNDIDVVEESGNENMIVSVYAYSATYQTYGMGYPDARISLLLVPGNPTLINILAEYNKLRA